ncbi:MAG TPA: peptidylprolyl isomerase, partial [Bacteroidia bacterium]
MKRFVLFIFLSGFTTILFAGKQPKDTALFTYGNKKVTTREFYRGFTKNKHKDSVTRPQEIDDYLELYKKFRLKVQDAYDMGLDTTEDFKSELSNYRKQIAKQFLMDTAVNEQLVQEAYQRLKYDLKASHILVFARPDASPEDTLKAFQKIMRIKEQIDSGKISFENAALQFSEDPSAGDNQGNLGYFTAFQMIYEFESNAYNTELNKVSKVFRTEFGYHILKVYDKRPSMGEITVRQIKIEMNPNPSKEEVEESQAKINEVYKKLQRGEKFVTMVHQYSEDASSVLKNGEINPFTMTTTRYPENFRNTAFSLKNDNDFSEPIQTAQGFYILQRVSLKPLEPINKMRGQLLTKISRDSRQYRNTLAVYEKAKKIYKFTENKKYPGLLKPYFDSSVLAGMFYADSAALKNPKLKNMPLFSMKAVKKVYTLNDFANWLSEVQKPSESRALSSIVNHYYEAYRIQTVMDYYEMDLENTSEKFAMLY